MEERRDYNKISEFNELYHELADIGDWNGLCMNLHVDSAVLNSLQMSGGRNEDKKRECLRSYFNGGNASWEGVIAAIVKHPIRNKRLAKKIAEKQHIIFFE